MALESSQMPLSVAPVNNPPNTRTESSHGISIIARGEVVGMIQEWTPEPQTRAITHIYELNALTSGHPVATVPGNLAGFTITVTRYDLWTKRMEEVFGGDDTDLLDGLGNQVDPFLVKEMKNLPDGTTRTRVYTGCWFASLGRNYRSTDTKLVMANGRLAFVQWYRV